MPSTSRFLISADSGSSELSQTVALQGQTIMVPLFVDLRPFGVPFGVAKYPVTNAIYQSHLEFVSRKDLLYSQNKQVYRKDPRFAGPNHAAVGVSYRDALGYCDWMAARFSEKVQLPDASTWERIAVCNKAKTYSTRTDECTREYVNFGLVVGATTPVPAEPPNEFGLHDMTGNVLEWTSTIPRPEDMRPEYGAMPVKNDKDLAQNRVLKGGNWAFDARNSRISATIILAVVSNYYTTGFRPVIDLG